MSFEITFENENWDVETSNLTEFWSLVMTWVRSKWKSLDLIKFTYQRVSWTKQDVRFKSPTTWLRIAHDDERKYLDSMLNNLLIVDK